MDQRQILLGILKNHDKTMFKEFLAFCSRPNVAVDESVRFLELLIYVKRRLPRQDLSAHSQGIYSTFTKDGAYWEVNLPAGIKSGIKQFVDSGLEPDFGAAQEEIISTLVNNNIVRSFIEYKRSGQVRRDRRD